MRCVICDKQFGNGKYYGLCQYCKRNKHRRNYYINKHKLPFKIKIPYHTTKPKQQQKQTKQQDNDKAEEMMYKYYTRDIKNKKLFLSHNS